MLKAADVGADFSQGFLQFLIRLYKLVPVQQLGKLDSFESRFWSGSIVLRTGLTVTLGKCYPFLLAPRRRCDSSKLRATPDSTVACEALEPLCRSLGSGYRNYSNDELQGLDVGKLACGMKGRGTIRVSEKMASSVLKMAWPGWVSLGRRPQSLIEPCNLWYRTSRVGFARCVFATSHKSDRA